MIYLDLRRCLIRYVWSARARATMADNLRRDGFWFRLGRNDLLFMLERGKWRVHRNGRIVSRWRIRRLGGRML